MIGVILMFYIFIVLLLFCTNIFRTIIAVGILVVINLLLKNKKVLIETIIYLISVVLVYISFTNVKMTDGAIPQFEDNGFLVVAFFSIVILFKLLIDIIKTVNENENKTKKKRKKPKKKVK